MKSPPEACRTGGLSKELRSRAALLAGLEDEVRRHIDEGEEEEGEVKICHPVTEEKGQESKASTEADKVGEKVQPPSPTNKENAGYAN